MYLLLKQVSYDSNLKTSQMAYNNFSQTNKVVIESANGKG